MKKNKKLLNIGIIMLLTGFIGFFVILLIRNAYFNGSLSFQDSPFLFILDILMLALLLGSVPLILMSGYANPEESTNKNKGKRIVFAAAQEFISVVLLLIILPIGVFFLWKEERYTFSIFILFMAIYLAFYSKKAYTKYMEVKKEYSKYKKTEFKPKNAYELLMFDQNKHLVKSRMKESFNLNYSINVSNDLEKKEFLIEVKNDLIRVQLIFNKARMYYNILFDRKTDEELDKAYDITNDYCFSIDYRYGILNGEDSISLAFNREDYTDTYKQITEFLIGKITAAEELYNKLKEVTNK